MVIIMILKIIFKMEKQMEIKNMKNILKIKTISKRGTMILHNNNNNKFNNNNNQNNQKLIKEKKQVNHKKMKKNHKINIQLHHKMINRILVTNFTH